mgnify:CR=1 FL=1
MPSRHSTVRLPEADMQAEGFGRTEEGGGTSLPSSAYQSGLVAIHNHVFLPRPCAL